MLEEMCHQFSLSFKNKDDIKKTGQNLAWTDSTLLKMNTIKITGRHIYTDILKHMWWISKQKKERISKTGRQEKLVDKYLFKMIHKILNKHIKKVVVTYTCWIMTTYKSIMGIMTTKKIPIYFYCSRTNWLVFEIKWIMVKFQKESPKN